MNIKEYILKNTIECKKDRIDKLLTFGSPKIVIESEYKTLKELEEGIIKISGDTFALSEEITSVKVKKGRGGVPYVVFNDCINYFPNARYGRYIKKNEC